MALIFRYFTEFGSFVGKLCQWLKIDLYCLWQKCSPKNPLFSDIHREWMHCWDVTVRYRSIRHCSVVHISDMAEGRSK